MQHMIGCRMERTTNTGLTGWHTDLLQTQPFCYRESDTPIGGHASLFSSWPDTIGIVEADDPSRHITQKFLLTVVEALLQLNDVSKIEVFHCRKDCSFGYLPTVRSMCVCAEAHLHSAYGQARASGDTAPIWLLAALGALTGLLLRFTS